jgi:Tfp pilus assembly protein PilX
MRPRIEGFAVLVVLALLAVIGLYTAATMHNSLFGSVLAGTRVLQQRAFLMADLGLERGMQDLAANATSADHTVQLHPIAGSSDSATVYLRTTGDDALPAGFSAGRFTIRRYEITSTGLAPRGARSVQVQGVARVVPLVVAP